MITDKQLQEFWIKYYPIIKGKITNVIKDPLVAEDIAGEVFVALVELVKKGNIRHKEAVELILFTILRRKIYDWMRDKYRNQPMASDFLERIVPEKDIVSKDYESKEFWGNIKTSMGNLTERQSEVFTMVVINGWRRVDVARKLDLSEGRVQQLVRRARQKVIDNMIQNKKEK